MLYFYSGTDREKARAEMNKAVAKAARRGARIVRVSDASPAPDLDAALRGKGMFGEDRAVVLESVLQNEEMRGTLLSSLEAIRESQELFFMFEEKPDAAARTAVEKHAERSERFEASKHKEGTSIFSLANALKRADKKSLWIGLERELAGGNAPEAIHGVLFWGAKQMLLAAREGSAEHRRGTELVAKLAELPHEARRNNLPLDYALLRFALSVA